MHVCIEQLLLDVAKLLKLFNLKEQSKLQIVLNILSDFDTRADERRGGWRHVNAYGE